jgi:hypothetical protein
MAIRICVFLSTVALYLLSGPAGSGSLFAKEMRLTPEEIVAAHLESLGSAEDLKSIKNRGMSGTVTVQFIQGGAPGKMIGQSLLVSAGSNLGIIMRYGALEYPGEHIAYNGDEVTVANISPGQRSPLADFIYRHHGLMKEGILGGVLSLGWPLLDTEKSQATLKGSRVKVEGQDLYQIDYIPERYMNDVRIKLFFEPDTFHHVRTEYRLIVHGEQALIAGKTYTVGAANAITRNVGILDEVRDSVYVLTETFDNFKEMEFKKPNSSLIKKITLPQNYSISYSVEGEGSTFLARWDIKADQWILNGKIDASFFKVQ